METSSIYRAYALHQKEVKKENGDRKKNEEKNKNVSALTVSHTRDIGAPECWLVLVDYRQSGL